MIKIVAVKAESWGSRIIRWGLGEPASHLAIAFPNFVIQSDLKRGFNSVDNEAFFEYYEEVNSVSLTTGSIDGDNELASRVKRQLTSAEYDKPGFIYFCWRAFIRKIFGVAFPQVNSWQDDQMVICVEVLYAFLDSWATMTGQSLSLKDRVLGMMTPLDCVRFCKESFPCKIPGQVLSIS